MEGGGSHPLTFLGAKNMNLVADRFLFKRFINCPRKAVFDYNRNTFQSKRLLKSPATLEEFTHELFENTIIMLIQKKKKGERFTQKLIYDTFRGVYEHIKEKKFQKINQEIIDVYEANLEKILLAIKTSIEKNLLGISDLFTYKSFELKTTMHVDLKRIVEKCKRDGFVACGIGFNYRGVKELYNYNTVISHSDMAKAPEAISMLINNVVKSEFQ